MSKVAYVTLLLNSGYLPGTLTLAASLLNTETKIPLILLLSKSSISDTVYDIIVKSNYFQRIIDIDSYLLKTRSEFELDELLNRRDLSLTLTKLNVWRLTDYDRLVYLDSDMLVKENIDSLFNIYDSELTENGIIASPDSGWPDIFNSGLFVIKPSLATFGKLLDFYENNSSFDGADQGLLNEFFNLSGDDYRWFRLPFVYNCTLNSNYEYLPAMIRFKDSIKIFHFIGLNKPWKNHNLCYDSTFAKIFDKINCHNDHSNGTEKENLYQLWWNAFEDINIENYSKIQILENSNNLQPRIELVLTPEKKENVQKIEDVKEEHESTVQRHVEIVNPFLSPDEKRNTDDKAIHFPTFYYKKPKDLSNIKDESQKGEAWKMSEGKFSWPDSVPSRKHMDTENQRHAPDLDTVDDTPISNTLNHLEKYVQEHPIFPWEEKKSNTVISRTFDNIVRFEPPAYSISIMNGLEDDDRVSNNDLIDDILDGENDADVCRTKDYEHNNDTSNGSNDAINDRKKLVGFDDGAKFEKFLHKVEQLSISTDPPPKVFNQIKDEIELEERYENSADQMEEVDSDIHALSMSKEDLAVQKALENDDNNIIGKLSSAE